MRLTLLLTALIITLCTTQFESNGSAYAKGLRDAQKLRLKIEKGKINYYERKMKKSYHDED